MTLKFVVGELFPLKPYKRSLFLKSRLFSLRFLFLFNMSDKFIAEAITSKGEKISSKKQVIMWMMPSYVYWHFVYRITVRTGLFINNEFVAGANTIDTVNPTTGEVIAAVQAGKC